MIGERPDFMDSPYFVMEIGNWHLKPGAPEEVVKEFEEFMKALNRTREENERSRQVALFIMPWKGGEQSMEGAKKTKLKKLEVNSVDLVPAGANPDAHINLFKSKEERPAWERFVGMVKKTFGMDEADIEAVYAEHFSPVNKQRIENEIWDYTSALRESFTSIMKDADLDADGRTDMLTKSMDEFTTAMQEVIPLWSTGQEALQKSLDDETVELYKQLEIESLMDRIAVLKAGDEDTDEEDGEEGLEDEEDNEEIPKEEEEEMRIDKSRLTTEEQLALDAIIKKSIITEEVDETVAKADETVVEQPAELQKMHDRVEELEKALAMKELEDVAKGYDILGKDTEELAKSLYAMKQAGAEAYAEFVGALDIAKSAKENSGIFTEIGKSRTETAGGIENKIEAYASEIQKADPSLSRVQAIAKAWEQNPDLVKEYDKGEM